MQQVAFDIYADTYDAHFTFSPIGKSQRKIVHNYLSHTLKKNQSVLELNSGTGEDALFISEHCSSVVLTDNSEKMLAIAAEKLKEKTNVKIQKADLRNLNDLDQHFDLIFSNFGGFNCLSEEDLRNLSASLSAILEGKGEMILVIMPEKCIWESVYFMLKGSSKKAFRRGNRNGIMTEINGAHFMTYYYSPKRIAQIFEKTFEVLKVIPVGFFLPPSYLNPFFAKRKCNLSLLEGLEKLSSGISFLAGYSDHYLVHLKKKSE